MVDTVYIESNIKNEKKTLEIISKLGNVNIVNCEKYTEVFNKKSQNFRLQKLNPSLIIAKKNKNFVLKTPPKFSIGSKNNYYFSHMMNCIYDCRYCFLQGMYNSANYLIYINYFDFKNEIEKVYLNSDSKDIHFFSGYDCDSLAFEPLTNFADYFIDSFNDFKRSLLELRTKSNQINFLLKKNPQENVIIAFSLNPESVIKNLEKKTPSLKKRLIAIKKLQQKGWNVGLRFDPIIYTKDFKIEYSNFFEDVFNFLNNKFHSITLGSYRMPKSFNHKISRLYPKNNLFKKNLIADKNFIKYDECISDEINEFCQKEILKYVSKEILFFN
ncbi:MAG: DNA photolyase [Rickettsiales bacterium]|nr:DNA photolyase [Rickettsiales bacterium]OUV52866.1 MAG: DNA photolyase [Rickettsiales bacterium TMED127]|tara:strand:+ start:7392 stop:8375 length:984 start_codon:yes stop_codon:yes gene_type:complete